MFGVPSSEESISGSFSEWNMMPSDSRSSTAEMARVNRSSRLHRSSDHTRSRFHSLSGFLAFRRTRSYSSRRTKPRAEAFSR